MNENQSDVFAGAVMAADHKALAVWKRGGGGLEAQSNGIGKTIVGKPAGAPGRRMLNEEPGINAGRAAKNRIASVE